MSQRVGHDLVLNDNKIRPSKTQRGRLDQRMNISTKAFIQEKEDVKKL